MKIEAVVFDLGGTLVEYAGPYAVWPDLETPGLAAAYDYFQVRGMVLPPFEKFRDTGFAILPGRWQGAVEGKRNLRLVDFLGEILHGCVSANGVQPAWLVEAGVLYQNAICAQAHLLPGALEALAILKRQSLKIGLLSNTMFTGAAHLDDLQRFNIDGYFDAMLFSADANKWKPQPDPYLHVLAELNVAPDEAIFVGDSPGHDVVGAHAAGMKAILIHSDRFPMVAGVAPDGLIHHLNELPALLAEM